MAEEMNRKNQSGKFKIGAAVLCGGRSKRMGRPKESVVIEGDGRTFLERICDEVDKVFPDLICKRYLSVREEQDINRDGYERVTDIYEDIGPLGGTAAVLTRAAEDGVDAVLILACDMTAYDHDEIRNICGIYDGEDILFARTEESGLQPLASIYSVSVLPAVIDRISKKDYRIRDLADLVNTTGYYDAARGACYHNQNTPSV